MCQAALPCIRGKRRALPKPMNKETKKKNWQEGTEALEILVAQDYEVQAFSDIHFRINRRLDVWPSTKKWWDSRKNKTGVYDELVKFTKDYLPKDGTQKHQQGEQGKVGAQA